MDHDPDLQSRMLEMIFGLLPDEEAEALRAEIEKDPALAEAYSEAKETAQLMGEAAKLVSPRIVLSRPEPNARTRPAPIESSSQQGSSETPPWNRWGQWVVMIAAGLLLAVSVLGWTRSRSHLVRGGSDSLRLLVTGPSQIQTSIDNRYSVTTTTAAGRPVSANVHFALYSPEGEQILGHTEKTDESGALQIDVAAGDTFPQEVRLEIQAKGERTSQSESTRISVRREPFSTYLRLDRLRYAPGDVLRYRSVTLSRFHLAPAREPTVHFEVFGPSGRPVDGTGQEVSTQRGVAAGEWQIPNDALGGRYVLSVAGSEGGSPGVRQEFVVERPVPSVLRKDLEFGAAGYGPGMEVAAALRLTDSEGRPVAGAELELAAKLGEETIYQESTRSDTDGGVAIRFRLPDELDADQPVLVATVDDGAHRESLVEAVPMGHGRITVDFFPEGGELAAVGENRVYFAARDENGEPVDLSGGIVDEEGRYVAVVATVHQGRGVFRILPRVGVRYRLVVREPRDVEVAGQMPFVMPTQKIVLNAGSGVFGPGEPIEFNVRASRPGLPLVAMATSRGVHVGEQAFLTKASEKDKESGTANAVAISLPDEVAGVLRLTVFDYSASPPRPLAERLVYRRPVERLDVDLVPDRESLAPGDECRLAVRVSDEKGRPAPALLGLAVVDEQVLEPVATGPATMATHFWLTSEVDDPQDLEDANFFLEPTPEAEVALDLLLGTQGWRRFAERSPEQLREQNDHSAPVGRLVAQTAETSPPLMLDNLASLKASRHANQESGSGGEMLAALIVLGGTGLMVLVMMMSLLRVAGGVRLWGPASVAVIASFFFVFLIMTPDHSGERTVAFVSYRPAETTDAARRMEGEKAEDGLSLETKDKEAVFERVPADETVRAVEGLETKPALPEDEPSEPAEMPAMEEAKEKQQDTHDLLKTEPLKSERQPMAIPAQPVPEEVEKAGARPEPKPETAAPAEPVKLRAAPRRGVSSKADEIKKLADADSETPVIVREYNFAFSRSDRESRSHFDRTVLWQPLLETDGKGRAKARFDLSDSITSYRAIADGMGEGRIGSAVKTIRAGLPFHLNVKLPEELTLGDRLDVPVVAINETSQKEEVHVECQAGEAIRLADPSKHTLAADGGKQVGCYFSAEAVQTTDAAPLAFQGRAGELADSVEKTVRIETPGYPRSQRISGLLKNRQSLDLQLPENAVDGSVHAAITVFPSSLAELLAGLKSIDGPGLDSALAAISLADLTVDSLVWLEVADPDGFRVAKERRQAALQRLASCRDSEGAYSFVEDEPADLAATAQALCVLAADRSRLKVRSAALDRTVRWLTGEISKTEETAGKPATDQARAYAWAIRALAAAGAPDLEAGLQRVATDAIASQDGQQLALGALAADSLQKDELVTDLLTHLAELQGEDGNVAGSGPDDVERTALAVQAWQLRPAFAEQASRASAWLQTKRSEDGGFGSPWATAWTLQTFVNKELTHWDAESTGKVVLRHGETVLAEQPLGVESRRAIVLDGLEAGLAAGPNTVTVELSGGGPLPYAAVVRFKSSEAPADSDGSPLELTTRLEPSQMTEGNVGQLHLSLKNRSDQAVPAPVLDIGLPAGVEIASSLLDAEKKAGRLVGYETQPRRVVLFGNTLKPGEELQWALEATASVPGRFSAPPSFAYPRRSPEAKCWAKPLAAEVTH